MGGKRWSYQTVVEGGSKQCWKEVRAELGGEGDRGKNYREGIAVCRREEKGQETVGKS